MHAWSPDSRQIVFGGQKYGNWDLFVISVEGGPPRRITDEKTDEVWPRWSNDGRWIFFASYRNGTQQIWKMPSSGGSWIQITKNEGQQALESADGRFLYYTRRNEPGIWMVPVDGGEEQKVLDHGEAWGWALTDTGILVQNPKSASGPVLELFGFASGRLRRIMPLPKEVAVGLGLAVSPDGKSILHVQDERRGSDIMLMENFR
jgi:hypothetical protein